MVHMKTFFSRACYSVTPCLAALVLVALASISLAGCESPIDSAAEAGDVEGVRTLLNGDPTLVFSRDFVGSTPLLAAARGDSIHNKEVAELLLAKGADVNAKNNSGATPLHAAAIWGRPEVAQVLLAHGAQVDAQSNTVVRFSHFTRRRRA
jgi:ankyrin repeat protein